MKHLEQTIESNQTEFEVIDWDKKIKEHRERIERENVSAEFGITEKKKR